MDEFALIKQYFASLSPMRRDVLKGVGDDAAMLQPSKNKVLLVSTDSLVLEHHFLSDWEPYVIGYKSLACNISDIAAMGGAPAWVSLALTLPAIDEAWLDGFSKGFKALLDKYDISLIGGDISKGPLQITVTIHGFAEPHHVLKRDGAKSSDKIYVTGALGAPAYAVNQLTSLDYSDPIFKKLFYPTPRIEHGLILGEFASSAIDISDGLCADLSHILQASQKGAVLIQDDIPLALTELDADNALNYALSGGDEYELCFTVPEDKRKAMESVLTDQGLSYFCIGTIVDKIGLQLEDKSGKIVNISDYKGFKHFD